MLKAILKSTLGDGQEFPIWVETREEADEAAVFLKATVVSVTPSSQAEMLIARFAALTKGKS